jgi:IS1 family transposase
MNKLPIAKKVQIINCLVEGMSLRATSRLVDVSINTVTKLLVDTGKACQAFHDETVHGLNSQRIEADEIWSFVYSKESKVPSELKGNGLGDVWTWTAIDADSKLIVSYFVGNRDAQSAYEFMNDVKSRVNNRVQLTTDGLKVYLQAVGNAFGKDVDFAMLKKIYEPDMPRGHKRVKLMQQREAMTEQERRYSPASFIRTEKIVVSGNPDFNNISTAFVERQNLTMRMHMRRFTRLTNGFSKKMENHCYAIALHFVYYNFAKIHKTLRVTPAMQAGLTKDVMSIEDIVRLSD